MIRIIVACLFIALLFPCFAEAKKNEIDYGYVNYQKGVSLHKEGELDSAAAYFSNVLSINPTDLPSLIKLASVFIELSKPDLAIPLLERAKNLSCNDAHIYLLLGKAYRENKQFNEAIDSFKRAAKIEPDNSLINLNIGLACFLMENYDCATKNLGKAILAYPNNLKIRVALGSSYHALKKYSLAKDQYETVLNDLPANYEILYNLAKVYIALGNYEEAKNTLTSTISVNSSKANLYLDRARVNYNLGLLEAAEEDYLQALTLEPVNPFIPAEYAKFLWETGAYLKAVDMYDLALKLQPGDEEFMEKKAYLFSLAGKYEDAEKAWEELLLHNSENTLALYNLAKLYEQDGKYEEAVDYYKNILSIEEDIGAKIGLAYSLQKLKRFSEAEVVYRDVLSKKTDDALSYYNYGMLLKEKGDYKSAEHYLQKAITYGHTPLTDVYRALIEVYKKLNDKADLETAYQRLIDIDKNDVNARIGYAEFLKNTGNAQSALSQYLVAVAFDKTGQARIKLAKFLVNEKDYFGAVGHLQEYLKDHPKNLEALILLAKAYTELRIPEQAINTYKTIISINTDNYLAYYNLGLLYEDLKKYDEAKNYLLKAIELNENYSPAYYALGLAYSLGNENEQSIKMFEKYLALEPEGEYKDSALKNIEELQSKELIETTAKVSPEDHESEAVLDEPDNSNGELQKLENQEIKNPFKEPAHTRIKD